MMLRLCCRLSDSVMRAGARPLHSAVVTHY
jgi:hypothetical protein